MFIYTSVKSATELFLQRPSTHPRPAVQVLAELIHRHSPPKLAFPFTFNGEAQPQNKEL